MDAEEFKIREEAKLIDMALMDLVIGVSCRPDKQPGAYLKRVKSRFKNIDKMKFDTITCRSAIWKIEDDKRQKEKEDSYKFKSN